MAMQSELSTETIKTIAGYVAIVVPLTVALSNLAKVAMDDAA